MYLLDSILSQNFCNEVLTEKMIPYEFIQRLLRHEVDSQTEDYIRFSAKMREKFYDYIELIVGNQDVPIKAFHLKIIPHSLRVYL